MTLADLSRKIEALPLYIGDHMDRSEARHLCDERLGILGVLAGQEPTPEQIAVVDAQLFPPTPQSQLL